MRFVGLNQPSFARRVEVPSVALRHHRLTADRWLTATYWPQGGGASAATSPEDLALALTADPGTLALGEEPTGVALGEDGTQAFLPRLSALAV